jgi:hypothetical protein
MTISSSAGIGAATAAAQSPSSGTVQTLVLGAVLQSQTQNAAALIASIPQIAPLATTGSIGTKVNSYA